MKNKVHRWVQPHTPQTKCGIPHRKGIIYGSEPYITCERCLKLEESSIPKKRYSFEELFLQHKKFALKQFKQSTWLSSLHGLIREIKEVQKEKNRKKKVIEYVDCLMYLLDSINREKITHAQLKSAFRYKLNINKDKRQWKLNKDRSYSHIKKIDWKNII